MATTRFDEGYDVAAYVANLRNYRSQVRELMDRADPDESHVAALARAVQNYPQPVRATMMTEDWCGDSATNLPILAPFFQGAGVEFRIFRGSETPELKALYEQQGTTHIPVVSLWDGDGAEIARWVEAPEAMQKRKDAWKAERPEFMELYGKQKTDKEAARQFGRLYREFIQVMAGWYRDGLWTETTREILERLNTNA